MNRSHLPPRARRRKHAQHTSGARPATACYVAHLAQRPPPSAPDAAPPAFRELLGWAPDTRLGLSQTQAHLRTHTQPQPQPTVHLPSRASSSQSWWYRGASPTHPSAPSPHICVTHVMHVSQKSIHVLENSSTPLWMPSSLPVRRRGFMVQDTGCRVQGSEIRGSQSWGEIRAPKLTRGRTQRR